MTGKQAASYTAKNAKGQHVLYTGDRLSTEELETVLEKHRAGLLIIGGYMPSVAEEGDFNYCDSREGCIMQHVLREPFPSVAFKANTAVAAWFDDNYKPTWTDWLLKESLINAGLIEQ